LKQDISDFNTVIEYGIQENCANDEKTLDSIAESLIKSEADVLLYSLPTGLQWAATAYAKVACRAGVAFVNCTPEIVARSEEMMHLFNKNKIPLLGDDLASHIGASIVHKELLGLLGERGITLDSSYQLNLGGNCDFLNLRNNGSSKKQSKLNCLTQKNIDISNVEVIPSAGFISHLEDHKVAYMNIEGRGWAGTPISIDLKLKVQDSSNAAGVIIDLIRIAAAAKYKMIFGFIPAAVPLLKSPPGSHLQYTNQDISKSLEGLH
jgi:myo-inositol-1-phosphate synthase